MAAAMITEAEASITPKDSRAEDLIHCSICRKLLQDPRSLSCLHSFCLKCLQQHIESAGKGVTSLSCPTCSTETKLSSGGVADLGVIAFVSRQRNERLIREKLADEDAKIMCTNCEEAGDTSSSGRSTEAVTRCFECDEYLCESCTKMHKTFKLLKHHPLFTLDELRSGNMPLSLPDQNTCQKHKSEILMFYCETCDVPICSKCAVIAHRHPEHKQAELDNTAAERSKKIQEVERESKRVATKIDELIASNEDLKQKLKAASTKALSDIAKTKESMKSQFLSNLEKTYKETTAKLRSAEDEKLSVLRNNLTELKNSRSRLSTSRMIARNVTQKGSEYEIAAVYATVTRSLRELCEQKHRSPSKALGEVKFEANKPILPEILKLGSVKSQLKTNLPMTKVTEFGALGKGCGIAFIDADRLVVSDHNGCDSSVYGSNGNKHLQICSFSGENDTGWKSFVWCMVHSSLDNRFYGTDDTQYVKVFHEEEYQTRYNVTSPDGTQSGPESSRVQGLAIDKDGNLIVGNVTKKYVSIMKPDGTHITSMYVPIKPWFISATPTDNIIISSYEETERAVHVIDRTGKVLITFNPPDGVDQAAWNPTGICCGEYGDVFVANYQGRVGVYQYDLEDGKYMGCNTNDVTQPWGLALSKDEKKLAVADNTRVKIFEIKIE